MPSVVGIDFGTSNSSIAVFMDGRPQVIPNQEGRALTPTVVALTRGGELLVGERAKTFALQEPVRTLRSFKRHLGSSQRFLLEDVEVAPEEVAAMVLQRLKADAERFLGEPVQHAVIAVPSCFNRAQRQAVKNAGTIAGLEVLRIIDEPTASALAYGLDKQDQMLTVLIFDLGGGTLSVSALEMGGGVFEVKTTAGDTHLGGDDWDRVIADHIADEVLSEHAFDIRKDRMAWRHLQEASEQAKLYLSSLREADISLPHIATNASGLRNLEVTITRASFEELSRSLVERCAGPTRQVLKDARLESGQIDRVLLVGGSTRMPMIVDFVRVLFDREPHRDINPDECIALGAAIEAGVLSGVVKDVVTVYVIPFTLGVETKGGLMTRLIFRNTTMPCESTQILSPALSQSGDRYELETSQIVAANTLLSSDPSWLDGLLSVGRRLHDRATDTASPAEPTAGPGLKNEIVIQVFEGEREMAIDNLSLGRICLSDLPHSSTEASLVQIEVKFDLDSNGILHVTARNRTTGAVVQCRAMPPSTLDEEQLREAIRRAEARAARQKSDAAKAETCHEEAQQPQSARPAPNLEAVTLSRPKPSRPALRRDSRAKQRRWPGRGLKPRHWYTCRPPVAPTPSPSPEAVADLPPAVSPGAAVAPPSATPTAPAEALDHGESSCPTTSTDLPTPPDPEEQRRRLEEAVQQAVEVGKREFADLQTVVQQVADDFQKLEDRLQPICGHQRFGRSSGDLLEGFIENFRIQRNQFQPLLDRQEKALGSFNVAFFGRTGSGKSTMIEAFSRGTGQRISDGRSDFTQEASRVDWEGCAFWDTPGIEGWGGREDREVLETRAREHTQAADLVLLCFDDLNQQQGEFEKIARWVNDCGKPVLALLNCKETRWRRPDPAIPREDRAALCRTVEEHCQRIRKALADIGLGDASTLALHAQRAYRGRARGPHLGPFPGSFEAERARFGLEALERASNFPALEQLLVAVLDGNASDLRTGMLRDELRGLLTKLKNALDGAKAQIDEERSRLEKAGCRQLNEMGVPREPSHSKGTEASLPLSPGEEMRRKSLRQNLRQEVQRLRDLGADLPPDNKAGEFSVWLSCALSSRTKDLRMAALVRAEGEIRDAFKTRTNIDDKKILEKAMDERARAELDARIKEILSEAQQRLQAMFEDLEADFRADVQGEFRGGKGSVQGDAGTGWGKAGTGFKVGGAAAGMASAVAGVVAAVPGLVGAVIILNPAALAAVAVSSVVFAVGSFLLSFFSDEARKEAERKKLQARDQALARIKGTIHGYYDDYVVKKTLEKVVEQSRDAVYPILSDHLGFCADMREILRDMETCSARLESLLSQIPAAKRTSREIFAEARQQVEVQRFPGDPRASHKLWRGEDWLNEVPCTAGAANGTVGSVAGLRRKFCDDVERFTCILQGHAGAPDLDSVRSFVENAASALVRDDLFKDLLADLDDNKARQPRLLLCGDYSSGKTAWVRRVHVEDKLPFDSSEIGAGPTTSEVREYTWRNLTLVDTPGFNSGVPGHEEEALHVSAHCAWLAMVLHPQFGEGSLRVLRQIRDERVRCGHGGRLHHVFLVVNRCDELADPAESTDEFVTRCETKKDELKMLLEKEGLDFLEDRVFFMAGAPHQSAVPDPTTRHWDGFLAFRHAVDDVLDEPTIRRALAGELLSEASRRLILEQEQCHQDLETLEEQRGAAVRFQHDLQRSKEEGVLLADEITCTLQRVLDKQVDQAMGPLLVASSDGEINKATDDLKKWIEDIGLHAELQQELDHELEEAANRIQEWEQKLSRQIRERAESPGFRHAFPTLDATGPEGLGGQGVDVLGAARATGRVGKLLGKVDSKAVLAIRDLLFKGLKFKPWGAVKLAAQVRVVGGVLGAASAAWDVWDVVSGGEEERARARDKRRREVEAAIRGAASQLLKQLTHGPADPGDGVESKADADAGVTAGAVPETSAGPVKYLEGVLEWLDGLVREFTTDLEKLDGEISEQEHRHATLNQWRVEAWALLNGTDERGTDA